MPLAVYPPDPDQENVLVTEATGETKRNWETPNNEVVLTLDGWMTPEKAKVLERLLTGAVPLCQLSGEDQRLLLPEPLHV